jgi:hypothetical protein
MSIHPRTVCIFLISPARDFTQERDLLVSKIFLELRRKCYERQFDIIDIDLLWGNTERGHCRSMTNQPFNKQAFNYNSISTPYFAP